jgi:hypothetical protein
MTIVRVHSEAVHVTEIGTGTAQGLDVFLRRNIPKEIFSTVA